MQFVLDRLDQHVIERTRFRLDREIAFGDEPSKAIDHSFQVMPRDADRIDFHVQAVAAPPRASRDHDKDYPIVSYHVLQKGCIRSRSRECIQIPERQRWGLSPLRLQLGMSSIQTGLKRLD